MKKFIFLLLIILIAGWYAQNFTSFKAFDYVKYYWQKIDWSFLKDIMPDLGGTPVPNPEKQLNIFIRDGKFLPNSNAAKIGIKVTWFNEDDKNHTVTGENWGSGELQPGQAYSRVFDIAGKYKYHCSIHPSMTGELLVE